MNFIFLTVKNPYLIYVLLKNSYFFLESFTIFYTLLQNFIKKNTKIHLKIRTKSSVKIFIGLKV